MLPSRRISLLCLAIALTACARPDAAPSDTAAGADARTQTTIGDACFRGERSMMGRTTPLTGAASADPGWLRLTMTPAVDSGTATLVDADGASMPATWIRTAADSIHVRAADDFLRVSMRIARTDSMLSGSGLATSDAELVRDSTGRLRELRREWTVSARRASCDDMPPAASRGS